MSATAGRALPPQAELTALVTDLRFDPAGLGVPERVPQQFPAIR